MSKIQLHSKYDDLIKQRDSRKKKYQFIHALLYRLKHRRNTVVLFSPPDFRNPYQTLIYSNITDKLFVPTTVDKLYRYQLLGLSNSFHIHWDEYVLPYTNIQVSKHYRVLLEKFKSRGGKLIWTLHNE